MAKVFAQSVVPWPAIAVTWANCWPSSCQNDRSFWLFTLFGWEPILPSLAEKLSIDLPPTLPPYLIFDWNHKWNQPRCLHKTYDVFVLFSSFFGKFLYPFSQRFWQSGSFIRHVAAILYPKVCNWYHCENNLLFTVGCALLNHAALASNFLQAIYRTWYFAWITEFQRG